MTLQEAVDELNNMNDCDQEAAHSRADDILCEYLTTLGSEGLAEAFKSARDRVGFWYA